MDVYIPEMQFFVPLWTLWVGGIGLYLLVAFIITVFMLRANFNKSRIDSEEKAICATFGLTWPLFVPLVIGSTVLWVFGSLAACFAKRNCDCQKIM